MSFGADIGAIWRSDLDGESKAVLTAIRYHGDAAGVAAVSLSRIVGVSGFSRRTVLARMATLVDGGWLERRHVAGRTGAYVVHATHQCEPRTGAPDAPPQCAPCTTPVRPVHGSPTPPNKVFQTSSRSMAGRTPARAHESHPAVEAAQSEIANLKPLAVPTPNDERRTPEAIVDEKLKGHPAATALRSIAIVAVEVLGTCPETFTLESWFQRQWALPRVRFGLERAVQKFAGKARDVGTVINSASNFMLRAEPHEYDPGVEPPGRSGQGKRMPYKNPDPTTIKVKWETEGV